MAVPCPACGWMAISPVARACIRCGAPVERGGGLGDIPFVAAHGPRIEADLASSSGAAQGAGHDDLSSPVAWSGYGSSVALLLQTRQSLALERLLLGGDGVCERTMLDAALPQSLLDELVAPPLAARIGTGLVSTSRLRLYVADDEHLPQRGATLDWSASEAGERICAAALSADGDIFFATAAGESDDLKVRSADGTVVAVLAGLPLCPGKGVGLAVHRRPGAAAESGELVFFAWAGGTLARQGAGRTGEAAELFAFDGLEAPALLWRERMAAESPVPWHGWRCAAAGVYPVETGEGDRRVMRGLVLGGDRPELVVFARGRHHSVVAESGAQYLLADSSGLRVVDPRSGHLIAQRDEPVAADSVFAGTGSGRFICLTPRAGGEVLMRGLSVRGGEIIESFYATLRRPSRGSGRAAEPLLRAMQALPPLETNEGLLVGFEQGAGDDARLRLWHGTSVFAPEAIS